MAEQSKKLVLAFPPFVTPTAAPLGICALKGYVERTVPDWSVKVVDLNLLSFELIFDLLLRGRPLDKRAFPEGVLAETALSRASEVFRGFHGDEFYQRPDRYSLYGELFIRLLENTQASFSNLSSLYRGGSEFPPFIYDCAKHLLREEPDAVGLSLCYSQQMWIGLCIAKAIKQISSVPIIFGGSCFRDDVRDFMQDFCGVVDYIISGEGEVPLGRLLRDLSHPGEIPGLTCFVDNQVLSCPPQFEENPDLLGSPDFSDLNLKQYFCPEPVVPILTSRGCYWRRCAYCVHYRSAGLTYRAHTVGHVLEQLKCHVSEGKRYFAFIDEMISPKQFSLLADAILEERLDIRYYALAKPVRQFSSELLAKMRRSGCVYLMWGVESGSQRVLDLMQKGTVVSEVAQVLNSAREAGLINHVYIMAGFPTETREEYLETLRFLEANQSAIYSIHRGIFQLEKDSPVYDKPGKFSLTRVIPVGDGLLNGRYEFECNAGMTRDEVRQLFAESLPFLRAFNPWSRFLGNFRDHALLVYSRIGENINPAQRQIPRVPIPP